MTKKLNISRRDFLNGVALSVAAGSSLSPIELRTLGLTNTIEFLILSHRELTIIRS